MEPSWGHWAGVGWCWRKLSVDRPSAMRGAGLSGTEAEFVK